MFKAILAIVAVSATVVQSASERLPAPAFDTVSEEYAIYSTIIDRVRQDDQTKPLLIVDRTYGPVDLDELLDAYASQQQGPHLSWATLMDYRRHRTGERQLADEFDSRQNCALLAKEEHDEIFKEGCSGWCKFYEKHPDSSGYMGFSRVGFNRAGTEALVYSIHGCGGLCGSGGYVFLVKQNNVWKIQKWMAAWIS